MITTIQNKQIKQIMKLKKNARERRKQQLFLVEGIRMFTEIPEQYLYKVYASEDFYKEHQAVFEGMIFSFIVAIGVLIDLKWGLNKDISWLEFIVIFAVLLSSVWLSAIEARRYARTQIREVILSYYSYCC